MNNEGMANSNFLFTSPPTGERVPTGRVRGIVSTLRSPDRNRNFDRRAFLKVGSLSLFGLIGYGDVLRLRAHAAVPVKRDIAVIHLLLSGGISQLDSWDPKPDADSKYRSQFKPIETNVSGIRISEHLPLTAKQA